MYCTYCGRICSSTRINFGPETHEDVANRIDNFGDEDVSSCCEMPVTEEMPLIGRVTMALEDPSGWDVAGLVKELREALEDKAA